MVMPILLVLLVAFACDISLLVDNVHNILFLLCVMIAFSHLHTLSFHTHRKAKIYKRYVVFVLFQALFFLFACVMFGASPLITLDVALFSLWMSLLNITISSRSYYSNNSSNSSNEKKHMKIHMYLTIHSESIRLLLKGYAFSTALSSHDVDDDFPSSDGNSYSMRTSSSSGTGSNGRLYRTDDADRCKRRFFATCAGAWVGCFVIPLDWDRPWQVFPVPNIFMCLCGYILESFADYVIAIANEERRR